MQKYKRSLIDFLSWQERRLKLIPFVLLYKQMNVSFSLRHQITAAIYEIYLIKKGENTFYFYIAFILKVSETQIQRYINW